jgi:phosphoglycerol transferase MdoB-like AlkP superfamily enzyme
MINATRQYLRDEIGPRAGNIIGGSELWLSLLIGIACAVWGDQILLGKTKIGDMVSGLLTYASIAFGFCLAGLTLALTLPDRSFAKRLATSKVSNRKQDAYSDLLFVFSWTAICHWVAIVAFIVALVVAGPQSDILPSTAPISRRVFVAVIAFITAYGVLRFLITLITLSQVGRLYIMSLSNDQKR